MKTKYNTQFRNKVCILLRLWLYPQSRAGKRVYLDKIKHKTEITGVRANIYANSVTQLKINLRNRTSSTLWFEPYRSVLALFHEKSRRF